MEKVNTNEQTVFLTTEDNPWNPFENWDEWYNFDMMNGYDTCGKIARLTRYSPVLPENINTEEIHRVMQELINIGSVVGNYGNVSKYAYVYKK